MSQSDFVTRGQTLVSSGQYQEAVKVCRLGLLGRPTTVEGRIVLGQALLALKRYDEVLAEMRVALELDHTSRAAQALKGEALLRKGDGPGAVEVLGGLRSLGLADAHVAGLLAEAERLGGRAPPGASHAVGLAPRDTAAFAAEPATKHYPAHLDAVAADPGRRTKDDPGSEYTRPTTLAAPSAKKRATPGPEVARVDATPPPAVLAIGDRSGTVEVDPERDAAEPGDDDFGEVVGPPVPDGGLDPDAVTAERATARGVGRPSSRAPRSHGLPAPVAASSRRADLFKEEASTVELDDEVIELGDKVVPRSRRARRRPPGPGTAVRNAVKMPSGPIDLPGPESCSAGSQPLQSPPPHLAQLIANQPHVMNVVPPPAPAQPPANPRGAIAAALPTAAALPLPQALSPLPPAMQPPMQPTTMQPPTMQPPTHPPPMQPPAMQPSMFPPAMQPTMFPPAMQPTMFPPAMLPPRPQARPVPPAYAQPPVAPPLQVPRSLPMQPPGMPGPAATPLQVPQSLPMPPMHGPAMQPTLIPSSPPPQPVIQPPPTFSPHAAQAMQPFPAHLPSSLAAVRPTIALNPAPHASAGAETLYNGQDGQDSQPAWARATMIPGGPPPYGAGRAGADEPTRRPHEIDPQIAALLAGQGPDDMPAAAFSVEGGSSESKSQRTGMRRRSRLQIALWVMIGSAVIGGGVFAGFQIRAIRLHKQIAAARDRAVDLARGDTWQGWIGARDSLHGIALASPTDDNKAALARVRALVAYEFGEGAADARALIDRLGSKPSLDLDLGITYVALAQNDLKTAREAAERAQQAAPEDPAALYVSGQTALLAGDLKGAVADLRRAFEREARPLYAVGLARALAASSAWEEALATIDRAGDNPAGVTTKASLLATAGRIMAGQGGEIRAQLAKVIAEGQKPPGEQPRGVSPIQVAFANLALAQLDFARNDPAAAKSAFRAALEVRIDDQRFAEEASETLYVIGDLAFARTAATTALKQWPASRRARTTLAQVWLALGKPAAALEELSRAGDLASSPRVQTIRGQARFAMGDIDGARADFDAALKKLAGYEPALIARTWLDLETGELDDARQRIEGKFNPRTATTGMIAVYAAVLRASGDPASRGKAKALLERVVGGAPSLDVARAQLERARIDRDLGDMRGAREAYAEASRSGNLEARLEHALLQIEDKDPRGGRDMLEHLLRDAGDQPPANLLLETARARMLTGEHTGAAELLARADKVPGVARWQLDRERGRLALRKSDTGFAAQALVRALEGCGTDVDTFILAADTLSIDNKQPALAHKLRTLTEARLKGRPELRIIAGKRLLAEGRRDDAEKEYKAARDALVAEKASARRLAQADYGLAAIAYDREDDPNATAFLDLVIIEDPSIYAAYLFAAEIAKPKRPRKALELAQQAALLNPDSLDAWKLVGTLAAQLNKTKLLGDRGKLLDDAIARVRELAPGSEALRQLQSLR